MFSKVSAPALAAVASLTALWAGGASAHQDQPYGPPASGMPQYSPPDDQYRSSPSRQYQYQQPQPDEPGAMGRTWQDPSGRTQAGYTQTCRYTTGPRAGQTLDYQGQPGGVSVQIGSRCADMQGSGGVAVAASEGQRQQGPGRFYQSPGSPNSWSNGQPASGYTLSCRFNRGPRLGSTFNFSGTLGAQPVAIGSPCSDGASEGIGVAPNTSNRWPDHPF